MSDRISDIRRTFSLFSAAETGVWPTWNGPNDHADLVARTSSLGVLLRIIPPGERDHLNQIASFLAARFSLDKVVTAAELRAAACESLGWNNRHSQDHANEMSCGTGEGRVIEDWIQQVRTSQIWTHLGPAVPGGPSRPIHEGYIERFFARHPRRRRAVPSIPAWGQSIESVLIQTGGRCLIIGRPGDGKTTLIKRIASAVASGRMDGFAIPIAINGQAYGTALRSDPDLTPLEFFFQRLNVPNDDVGSVADAFRQRSPALNQAIFLVDDCDAIPDSLQHLAQSHLSKDAKGQAIVMTARSPPLFEMKSTACYRMVPLSKPQQASVINRTLASHFPDVPANMVLDQVQNQVDFQSIASSPYWLSMLTIVVAGMHRSGFPASTITALEQMIAWERNRCAGVESNSHPLSMGHIQALAQTAYLCCNRSETDSFSRHECEVIAADFGVDAAEILQSRFVHQPENPLERYQFVENAFLRYFAAHYVANALDPKTQEQFFGDAMVNPAKLPVMLGALHLSPELRFRCRAWVAAWLNKIDCFDQVIDRVSQVVIAAKYDREDLAGPVPEIREKLWGAAKRSQSGSIRQSMIRRLSDLDDDFLIRKMVNLRDLDSALFSSLAELVSPEIFVAVDACRTLGVTTNQVQHSVLDDRQDCSVVMGIEQPLIRLALLPPDHPHVREYLMQLVGRPIDGQFQVLVQVALSNRVDTKTRALAIDTLAGCDEGSDLSSLASLGCAKTNPDVIAAVVRLSTVHQITLNRHALEEQIGAAIDPNFRQVCLKAYLNTTRPNHFAEAKKFLCRLVCKAFLERDLTLLNSLWLLLNESEKGNLDRWFDSDADASAADHLVAFLRGTTDCDLDMVSMAATWLSIRTGDRDLVHLRAALEKSLSQMSGNRKAVSGLTNRNLASVLTTAILRRDPSILMSDLWERPIVKETFARMAWAEGWLVYRDRVVNANGATIAVRQDDPLAQARFSTPEVVQEISKQLSPRQRNDFLSYWHMVSEGGEDFANLDRKAVYHAMCTVLDSDLNTPLVERLLMCYSGGTPPKFSTWKKNLIRVVQRCSTNSQWLAHLQKIGLGTYRNSSDRSQC
jgi:hypothetical protein